MVVTQRVLMNARYILPIFPDELLPERIMSNL
jgi:hypothetical protein